MNYVMNGSNFAEYCNNRSYIVSIDRKSISGLNKHDVSKEFLS